MTTPSERYEILGLRDSLPISFRYPIACKELAFILRQAYNNFPKNLQSLIFQDTLSAFRILPQIQTQNGVSAAHFLLQSVEAVLPKQKKNVAVKEFKHAMVVHKRCSKAHQVVEEGSFQLPQDVLVHIFSFLDMQSLVSVGLVCWSWNLAANDNCLWELQYGILYGNYAKLYYMKMVEENNRCLREPIDTRTVIDWKEAVKKSYSRALSKKLTANRGYCEHCTTVVWLNNTKCPNKHCGTRSGIHGIKPVTAFQVVEYLLDSLSVTSSSSSDTDSEEGPASRLWAYPKLLSS